MNAITVDNENTAVTILKTITQNWTIKEKSTRLDCRDISVDRVPSVDGPKPEGFTVPRRICEWNANAQWDYPYY